ncbi:hypothetical protein [Pseudorhodoferax sp. Leaf267]|uniref:hypothetical protein n=1 Tax=Pseudorhodoferax sp. Leaf267 TaxID=1736316 RepID=UPI0012E268E5|nr:hypothetical protein [Pseudorhodoferax sp. Leaf267]
MRWSQVIYRAGCALTALLLTGCGSIVYKDAASTYATAGRAATKSVADAAASLANAQDKLKASQVASNSNCPIAEQRIFLRSPELSKQLKAALGMVPGATVPEDCKKLVDCDTNPNQAACRNSCASAEEANCIATVEENLAIHLKSLKGAEADSFSTAVQPVANAISQSEYGRVKPVAAVLVKDNLIILTEYLDMLEKLAVKRESEVAEDAKKLSKRITDTMGEITKLTGKQLSTEGKETQTKVTNAIAAMGKFVSDLQVIAANAQDAHAIRKHVVGRSKDVQELVASIKEVAGSDAMLGAVYSNLAQIQARTDYQRRYASAGDAYSRSILLSERGKYSYVDGEKSLQAVDTLFDAMTKSHEALIQLVMNPSEKDKQAIADARFQEFKMIAEDVATLIQLF